MEREIIQCIAIVQLRCELQMFKNGVLCRPK